MPEYFKEGDFFYPCVVRLDASGTGLLVDYRHGFYQQLPWEALNDITDLMARAGRYANIPRLPKGRTSDLDSPDVEEGREVRDADPAVVAWMKEHDLNPDCAYVSYQVEVPARWCPWDEGGD